MAVRRMQPEDYEALRAIRLRALQAEPASYGSTYEREATFTDDVWQQRLRPEGNPHFVSDAPDGSPDGIVAVAPDDTDPQVADLVGMWVDPEARGTGVADALVTEVVRCAARRGFVLLRLHFTDGNARAEHAYLRHGFRRTGRSWLRERDGLTEVEMERPVRADAGP